MKKLFFIILFVGKICIYFSQSKQQIDSVKKLITVLNSDSARLRNYLLLAEWITDEKEWFVYTNKALDITDKHLNDPNEKEADMYLHYKANAINNVGYYYKLQGDFKKAGTYYKEGMEIHRDAGNRQGMAAALINLGALDVEMGKAADGVKKYNEALKIFRDELHDEKFTPTVLNNIGNLYLEQGNTKVALTYFDEALSIFKRTKNILGEVLIYSNFGSLYYNQKDYKTAADFLSRSQKIYNELGDKTSEARMYSGLAVATRKINLPLSLHYDSIALDMNLKLDNAIGIARGYNNLGTTLCDMKRYAEGKSLLYKALYLREKTDDLDAVSSLCDNIAEMFLKQKMADSALFWGLRAERISSKLDFTKNKKDVAFTLSQVYAMKKDFEKAYRYHLQFKMLSDSVLNIQSKNSATQQLSRLEFEKRELELKAEQDKKDLLADDEKRKQKIVTVSVSIGLLMVLILAGVIFRSLKQNQKKNKIITEQKELVEIKQKEILDSITYARRIQQSLLPSEKMIDRLLGDDKKKKAS